jgi:hypothetical protein
MPIVIWIRGSSGKGPDVTGAGCADVHAGLVFVLPAAGTFLMLAPCMDCA